MLLTLGFLLYILELTGIRIPIEKIKNIFLNLIRVIIKLGYLLRRYIFKFSTSYSDYPDTQIISIYSKIYFKFIIIIYNIYKLVLALQRPVDIKNRPRIPIPDEDPYSIAGVSSSIGVSESFQQDRDTRDQIYIQSMNSRQKRTEKPPKLPPRENLYSHDIPKVII